MAHDPHPRPSEGGARPRPRTDRARGLVWRVVTVAIVAACGLLFVTSAISSDGTDLRPGRYTDFASLVQAETEEAERLTSRVSALNADVDRLGANLGDLRVDRFTRQIERVDDAAGLTPVTGASVTVTLSDAPDEVRESTDEELRWLVVHQQDIQAVANALWSGGAEALMVNGQRVISTTGIKCHGSNVMLQGVSYPAPYTITAIGDQVDLLEALETDPRVAGFRADAADPDIAVGYALDTSTSTTAPAYEGLLDLSYATVLAD